MAADAGDAGALREALARAEQRLADAERLGGLARVELTPEGGPAGSCASLARLCGAEGSEVSLPSLLAAPERPRLEGLVALCREEGSAFGELHLRRPDGSELPVRVFLRRVCDAQGRPVRIEGLVRGLDAASELQRDAEERGRELRAAFDRVPHFFSVKGSDGRFWFANRALAAAYGRHPDDMFMQRQSEIHAKPDEAKRMLEDDRRVLETGAVCHVAEEVFTDDQGHERVLESWKVPFRVGPLGHASVFGVSVDVTRRKRAQEAQVRLALALDQAADAIAVLDRAGRILFANPALARMVDRPPDALAGQPFHALSTGSDTDRALLDEMQRTLLRGDVWKGRYQSVWPDGSRYVRDATVTPVRDAGGTVVNYIGVIRDVTREQELEEELRQAQKMEAVARLAGGAAHDFNNMLTVITGRAEELLLDLDPKLGAGEALREILDAAERSARITSQLLAFGRRQLLAPEPLDLSEVVASLEPMLRSLLRGDIELSRDTARDLGAVEADRGEIERVVLNLVVNAQDAMPEGGALRLRTFAQEIGPDEPDELPPGRYVALAVEDDGTGMTPEVRSRIFEPFFTTKAPGAGSGLGLSSAHGIVRQSGGAIRVESEPGVGSRFTVLLPRAGEVVIGEARPLEAVGPLEGGSGRVLVAEDEPGIRRLVSRVLERAGYQVVAVGDGVDAMEAASRSSFGFDLLIADVVMPRMGGLELARRLLERHPQLPVIYSSGFIAGEDDRGRRPPEGARLLRKPFRPETLLRSVRDALDKARRSG